MPDRKAGYWKKVKAEARRFVWEEHGECPATSWKQLAVQVSRLVRREIEPRAGRGGRNWLHSWYESKTGDKRPKPVVAAAKKKANNFYRSWEWKKLRFRILKRYGAVCMCCNATDRIVVDHIKPRSRFPHLELDPENLQVLCNDCNMGKSNDDYTDFRPGTLTESEYDELHIVSQAREVLH